MNVVKVIGSVVALVLPVIGHSGLIPVVPAEVFTGLATLIAGWLHLPQPVSKAK